MWTWHFFHKLLRCPWHDGGGKDTVSSHPSNKCNCPMCKNGYHLRKKIGEGGFGAVYTSSKDDLAIKITSNCDLNDSIMEYKVLMQVAGHAHIHSPSIFTCIVGACSCDRAHPWRDSPVASAMALNFPQMSWRRSPSRCSLRSPIYMERVSFTRMSNLTTFYAFQHHSSNWQISASAVRPPHRQNDASW